MRGRDGPPDKRLFRRARHGDRQAFGLLLRRYDPRLRRLVLRLVAEPERVDPVLRRAYVKAWRSLPMVDLPGTVAEWLYRVVYNACVNELRWAPERPPPPPASGARVPMPVASPERRLAGLRALTPEERIPLALVDGEGFSLEATARILQRPPVAVAADLSRARGRWRGFVLGDAAGADGPEVVELEPDVAAEQAEAEAAAAAGELGIEGLAVDSTLPEGQPRHVRVVSTTIGNGDAPMSTPLDATEDQLGGEPATQDPVADERAGAESAPKQPAAQQPAAESVTQEPAAKEPAAQEPAARRRAADEPAANGQATEDPAAGKRTAAESVTNQPPTKQSAVDKPAAQEPVADGSAIEEPAADAAPAANGPSGDEVTSAEDGAPSGDGATQPAEEPADGADEDLVSVPAVVEVVEEVVTEDRGKRPRNNGSATPSSSSTTRRTSRTEKSAAEKAAAGAGARRKRRRDAKRDVRTRSQRAPSERPSDETSTPGPDGDSHSSDDPHETS